MWHHRKTVLIRERVAVSSMVNQSILCFGHLLENGWCADGQQQALTQMAGAHIPIALQNRPMVVQDEIRMLREEFSSSAGDFHARAIQADVMDYIVQGTVGWELDDFGRGIGRHFADRFSDPILIRPGVSGSLFRTTLIEGDDRKWYVVELSESVPDLIHHHSAWCRSSWVARKEKCDHNLDRWRKRSNGDGFQMDGWFTWTFSCST